LKIIDFDLSYSSKEQYVRGKGTVDFRALELRDQKGSSLDVYKCDVFSAGIILFALLSGGVLPFKEATKAKVLYDHFKASPKMFWADHVTI